MGLKNKLYKTYFKIFCDFTNILYVQSYIVTRSPNLCCHGNATIQSILLLL